MSDTFLASHSSTNQIKGISTPKEKILVGLIVVNMLVMILLMFAVNMVPKFQSGPGVQSDRCVFDGGMHKSGRLLGVPGFGAADRNKGDSGATDGQTFACLTVAVLAKPAPQDFAYVVADPHTGNFNSHQQMLHGDVVEGSYTVVDPNGIRRIVHYTADDAHGFTAVVEEESAGDHHEENSTQEPHHDEYKDEGHKDEEEQKDGQDGKYYEEEQKDGQDDGMYHEEEQKDGQDDGKYHEEEQKDGQDGKYYEEEQKDGQDDGMYHEEEHKDGQDDGKYHEEDHASYNPYRIVPLPLYPHGGLPYAPVSRYYPNGYHIPFGYQAPYGYQIPITYAVRQLN
ncbi:unnamed protein product [Tenebrio molitor]|nr:unnamed protein product [Tenebrio molitor]